MTIPGRRLQIAVNEQAGVVVLTSQSGGAEIHLAFTPDEAKDLAQGLMKASNAVPKIQVSPLLKIATRQE